MKDIFLTKKVFKSWEKIKRRYKFEILSKRVLLLLFGNSIGVSFFKLERQKNKHKFAATLASYLVKPFFKLDTLLWVLRFFPSTFETRQQIAAGRISMVGSKHIKGAVF